MKYLKHYLKHKLVFCKQYRNHQLNKKKKKEEVSPTRHEIIEEIQ